MPSGDPRGLTTQITNDHSSALADGSVQQIYIDDDTTSVKPVASATLRDVLAPVAVVIARQQDLPVDANGAAVVQGVADALASGATDIVKGDHLVVSGQKFVKADTAIFTKAKIDTVMTAASDPDAPNTSSDVVAPDPVSTGAATSTAIAAADVVDPTAATSAAEASAAVDALTVGAVPNDNLGMTAAPATLTGPNPREDFATTHTIDAGLLKAGDWLDIYASGFIVGQNAADTHQMYLSVAGIDVGDTTAVAAAAGDVFEFRCRAQIRTDGVGGTFLAVTDCYLGDQSAIAAADGGPSMFSAVHCAGAVLNRE